MGTGDSFSGRNIGRGEKLTTHFSLVPKLRVMELYFTPLLFMA
jgi:hypothetical protein